MFQLTIDCADPARLVTFWAVALDYTEAPPPAGHESWADWYRAVGVPEEEIGSGVDRLVDPAGNGPAIWFQQVPEPKTVKNRLHLDILAGGGRGVPLEERHRRVDAKIDQLLAAGATKIRDLTWGDDYYAWVLADPEGNEFCVA